MSNLISLPTEILHHICFSADAKTRQDLRLTCRLFAGVGRQWVFEKVTVRPGPKNYTRLDGILADDSLCRLVSKIYLDIRQWDPYNATVASDGYDRGEGNDTSDNDEKEEKEDDCLPKALLKIFNRLLESPKFRSVALRFHHVVAGLDNDWGDERHDQQFRLNVIKQIMSSLLSAPQLPQELAIQDMHNVNETDPTVVAMITKVLGGLQSLRLNIMNEHDEGNGEHDLESTDPHVFYPEVPSFWIKPAMSNLQHLTIYSSLFFGFYPKFDLRGIHLPQLKTLSFGNYCFIHDSQLDWILSHGATLTELYLDDCPILFEVSIKDKDRTYLDPNVYEPRAEFYGKHFSSYARRWCDYFKAFKDGLPRLRHFRYGGSPNWWDDDTIPFEQETSIKIGLHDESYMVFCDGFGPSPYMKRSIYAGTQPDDKPYKDGKPLDPSDEDKEALRDLHAKIGQMIAVDEDDY
ncbi:hypothetical protein AJ80_06162 [Polytolypa hystricis UAMH7299]|uniref:F-box domain-containing protein n=1 Tax=Polytolypa hystricis (strain UAMH7299) TaxID=1447883 RepID=A0A2B7XYN8_POLH7|nr:hypothetical protein AJ80_06162 [Polytolypa hystricis UAMH7299]